MPKKFLIFLSLLTAIAAAKVCAESDEDTVVFAKPSLNVSQEVTRVVKGGDYISSAGLDKAWIEPTGGNIDFQVKKNERLGLEVMVAATYFAAPYQYDQVQNYVRNISVSAPRLDASYIFGDLQHPFLKVDGGIFTYKYNESARNLGEYMFRTWAYPGIIETGGTYGYLGYTGTTLTGLKLSQSFGAFSQDFIASIETEMTPVYDLNLTYMFKFNFHDILKIGGGVQLERALSAFNYSDMTVHYFQDNGVWYADGAEGSSYYASLQQGIITQLAKPGATAADSARLNNELAQDTLAQAVLDSVSEGLLNPQLHRLTARAIKPDLYFSFDPKPLIGSTIFGNQDLVLYGEAAILGTQDYPVYYTSILRRIPVMFGFNVPTFKLLDVLSMEFEYYGSEWLPTYRSPQLLNGVPAPFMGVASYYPSDWDKDNWKWSIYAERTLVHGLTISGQMASDHSRSWDWNVFGKTPWEIYTSPSQWYWGVKLGVKI